MSSEQKPADVLDEHSIPLVKVFNDLPAVTIGQSVTAKAGDRADSLFERIRQAPSYRPNRETAKRSEWRRLFTAAMRATWLRGCIRYSRRNGQIPRALLRVIDCAVEAGLFVDYRSKRGAPKSSRLIPTAELRRLADRDPWKFDPPVTRPLVRLLSRGDDQQELAFDPAHPIAADAQLRLELVNATNARHSITFTPYCRWADDFVGVRQLRPVLYVRFTECFDWHGRLYTCGYSHQSIRKIERRTIKFGGRPSVELDYGAMHCRLLYHLAGLDYADDPYALWGVGTTRPQRLLAKTLINALINATTPTAAVAACNSKSRTSDDKGRRKSGKELDDARRLLDAIRSSGQSFKEVHRLAVATHAPIAHYFGCDMGMRLMRIDGAIALDVLHHFARQGIPALSCHDSFLVPASNGLELARVMHELYEARTGHTPNVNATEGNDGTPPPTDGTGGRPLTGILCRNSRPHNDLPGVDTLERAA